MHDHPVEDPDRHDPATVRTSRAHEPTDAAERARARLRRRRRRSLGLVALGAVLVVLVSIALWTIPAARPGESGSSATSAASDSSAARLLDAWEQAAADPQRGAAPLGSRSPQPPADATWVQAGATGGDGSKERPFASISEALAATGNGVTIVVRAGVYHESVYVIDSEETPRADVTIQAHPGEEVWLDGSEPVEWSERGGRVVAPFEDHRAWNDYGSYGDYDEVGDLAFTGEQNPVAADPTEVWVDDGRLWQVPANPGPGEFAVERAERRDAKEDRTALLVLGEKPSADAEVRVSARNQAVVGKAPGLTLDGFGIRRFGTPVNWMGSVYLQGERPVVRDLVLEDLPSNALSLSRSPGALVEHVTVRDPGLEGIGAVHSDGSTFRNNLVTGANHNLFNAAPVAAGMKLVQMKDFTITSTTIANTREATGLWIDESAVDFTLSQNLVTDSGRNGMQVEISGRAAVVDNTILRSKESGLLLYGSQDVEVRGNLIAGSGGYGAVSANLTVLQDSRRAADGGMGVDVREGTHGLQWVSGGLDVRDNILALPAPGASAQVAVLDQTSQLSAGELGLTLRDSVLVTDPETAGTHSQVPTVLWRADGDEVLDTPEHAAERLGDSWAGNATVQWPTDQRSEGAAPELAAVVQDAARENGTTVPTPVGQVARG